MRFHVCITGLLISLLLLTAVASAQQQLQLADTVLVVSGPLNVRDAPGTGAAAVGQLLDSQTARIVDAAPYWADGYWWWNIQADGNILGWVAEGAGGEDYIVLLRRAEAPQAETPTPAPVADPPEEPLYLEPPNQPPAVPLTDDETPPEEPAVIPEPEVPEPPAVPHAHLPEAVREQRLLIDDELDGLRLVMAHFRAGPGRGGFAFGWATDSDAIDAGAERFYWCGSGLLTAGPPFFQRVEPPEAHFTDGELAASDLTVSCTESGNGVQAQAETMDRLLAYLAPATTHALQRSGIELAQGLLVADAMSLTLGDVSWLEVSSDGQPAGDWKCATAPASVNPLLANTREEHGLTCERDRAGTELLTVDAVAIELRWEIR